jgi:hypothetical protein
MVGAHAGSFDALSISRVKLDDLVEGMKRLWKNICKELSVYAIGYLCKVSMHLPDR